MRTLTRIAIFTIATFASAVAFGQDRTTITFGQDRTNVPAVGTAYAPGPIAVAQDKAPNRVRLSITYKRTDFPYPGQARVENVNGFTAEADVQVFKTGGLRGSLAYDFDRMLNQEIYPNYNNGMGMVDLYRDVDTHSGGAQLEYVIKDAFGLFGGLFYGTRKIHPDAPRQTVRDVKVGVIVPFHKKSRFFAKSYVGFEKPYGTLPTGFINPATRTLSLGGGIRF